MAQSIKAGSGLFIMDDVHQNESLFVSQEDTKEGFFIFERTVFMHNFSICDYNGFYYY